MIFGELSGSLGEGLRDQVRIWRLRRQQRILSIAYSITVKGLRAENKTESDIDILLDEQRNELYQLDFEIAYAESNALIARAVRLKVPSHQKTDTESWDSFYGVPYLTHTGYDKLRSRIRQEKKERREAVTAVIKDIMSPIGSLVISILSLLIAYAALRLNIDTVDNQRRFSSPRHRQKGSTIICPSARSQESSPVFHKPTALPGPDNASITKRKSPVPRRTG